MAVRQEATLLYVSHKAPDWNVVQDKFKVVQLLDGFTQLVYLRHTQKYTFNMFLPRFPSKPVFK